IVTTWKDFLSNHAKFPFPQPIEGGYVSTTDISTFGVALLDEQWKAQYAIQDKNLPHKLCQTLENILGDVCLPDGSEDQLLSMFGRRLKFSSFDGREWMDTDWNMNASEYETRTLLDKGFFRTAGFCLGAYGGYHFHTMKTASAQGGDRSKVDYVGLLDREPAILVEAKSPSVMKAAALYLGQRKMEWLFLTSHNSWIIRRLVRGVGSSKPFLAFSRILSIENSSVPFWAFLGAVLSVRGGAPIQSSEFNPRKFIGFGSTGNVWQCYFDYSDGFFATKVVELLRKSDVERQRRFCKEFGVHLTLEMAYQSGQLRDRITPHCYGGLSGEGVNVLILEPCGSTLKGEYQQSYQSDYSHIDNIFCRSQLYVLVCDLHRVGILHGDLEPQNIARVPGGGFRLIDFSEVEGVLAWLSQYGVRLLLSLNI
ncbi:hypothetical protein EDB87DRAFT_1558209, partial [Lactarius vividus]